MFKYTSTKPYSCHVGDRGQPLTPSLPRSSSKKEEAILMTIKAASEHVASRQSSPGKGIFTCDVCNCFKFMILMMSLSQRQREIQDRLSPLADNPLPFKRYLYMSPTLSGGGNQPANQRPLSVLMSNGVAAAAVLHGRQN